MRLQALGNWPKERGRIKSPSVASTADAKLNHDNFKYFLLISLNIMITAMCKDVICF